MNHARTITKLRSRIGAGFTLIETLIAITVFTVGALSVSVLVERSSFATSVSASQLAAGLLAQEGIEIARNIRDTNLLKIHQGGDESCKDELASCSTGCEADYTDLPLSPGQDRFVEFNGEPTKFKRKITITSPTQDSLEVLVEVSWTERASPRSLQAATKLFNWFSP